MDTFRGYHASALTLIEDSFFKRYVEYLVPRAKKRIWVAQFLVNAPTANDPFLYVRSTVEALGNAVKRNVDVRLLIDPLYENIPMHSASAVSLLFAKSLGIRTLYYAGMKSSLHCKYMIIDHEAVILGSHNFTDGALRRNRELSVAVSSRDLNIRFEQHFLREWRSALGANVEIKNDSEEVKVD